MNYIYIYMNMNIYMNIIEKFNNSVYNSKMLYLFDYLFKTI